MQKIEMNFLLLYISNQTNKMSQEQLAHEQKKPIPFDTYLTDGEHEDVCCVGCGECVCGFHEDPPYKNLRDEAVCDDCVKCLWRHEFTTAPDYEKISPSIINQKSVKN